MTPYVVCILASYTLALALELVHLRVSRPAIRVLALVAAGVGLVAHTRFLYDRQPPLIWQFSWMLFLAWVLAIFYLCGAVHYRRLSWGVFVLPLVIGLLGLAVLFGPPPPGVRGLWQEPHRLWGPVHVILLLLATVGVCVGFLASLMYLIHAHRLRTKAAPGVGLKILSLERLEAMNRRAIVLSFPLLTAGMLAGAVLMLSSDQVGWADPRVAATVVLWLVFGLMLYLRFGRHARGRPMAFMTIAVFALLLCCLAISHPLRPGE
jgi:ABC-type transport system involved in cytochrome c biogenesis permease subunit